MTTFQHAGTTTRRVFAVTDAPVFDGEGDGLIDPQQVTVEFNNGRWLQMEIRGFRIWSDGDRAGGAARNIFHREDVPDWAQPLTDPNFDGGV